MIPPVRLQSAAALMLLVCCATIRAESWDALRDVKPGAPVRVVDRSGKDLRGAFVSFSADAIVFKSSNADVSVERLRVRQVRVRTGARRVRNALIGAGIGLALGIVVDNTVGRYLRNETGEDTGVRALTYIAPVALFGGIGAARPAWRTVYKAR